jgi:pristinamycin I synthase-3/4
MNSRVIGTVPEAAGANVASPLVMMALARLARMKQEEQWLGQPEQRQAPQVVCLRAGPANGPAPLVCVHPIGGSVIAYKELTQYLAPGRAVYGIQSQPGDSRSSLDHATLDALAADYVQQIEAMRLGPSIVLSGYSLGGAVAFEMARQLSARGTHVASVIIIDTPSKVRPLAEAEAVTGAQLHMFGQMLASARGATLAVSRQELAALPAEAGIERLIDHMSELQLLGRAGRSIYHDVYRLVRHNEALQRAHTLGSGYAGTVHLIRTADETPELRVEAGALVDQIDFGWQAHCRQPVQVRHIPGSHFALIYPPYIAGLGKAVQACLEAQQQPDLVAMFDARVAAQPRHTALRQGERQVSYAGLQAQARTLAARLQAAGAGPDTLVGICGARTPEYVVAMLATLMTGAAYLPLDPAQPEQNIRFLIADARPLLVLADAAHRDAMAAFGATVLPLETVAADGAAPLAPALAPRQCAYVMYTSGSTGQPKGVRIAREAIVRLASDHDYVTLGQEQVVLQHSNLCFDASTFEIWSTLLNGATCVLMPHARPSLQQYQQVIAEYGVSTIFMTSALFHELAARRPQALAGVREVLTGGDVLSPAAVRQVMQAHPALTVVHMYGPTECTVYTLAHRIASAPANDEPLPLGQPVADARLLVLDASLQPVAGGAEGELCVGGAGLALDYLNRPELTASAFVQLPDAQGRLQTWYRTGDRVQRCADGALRFRGRVDRQVKLRGFRVELGEVEAAVLRHTTVADAVVRTLPMGGNDKALAAYVVPASAAIAPNAEQDAALLAERTAHWEQVYSKLLYKSLASADQAGQDPTMNTSGWKSSFDGRPIAAAEMEEWIAHGVDKMLALKPRHVLEIGCGTGMVLFRVAPHCVSYAGTDFAPEVIDYVRARLGEQKLDNVSLHRLVAHELPPAPPGGYDTVIINSVTEHFPSLQYLDDVLRGLVPLMKPGGHIFVGDNRNAALLPLFHGAIQLFRSPGETALPALVLQAEQARMEEPQLTIDPAYFHQLADAGLQLAGLELKRGHFRNEMTQYRFDAVLRVGAPSSAAAPSVHAWQAGHHTLAQWRATLQDGAALPLLLTGLPNARIPGAALLHAQLGDAPGFATAGQLQRAIAQAPAGEEPEDWRALGAQLECQVELMPGAGGDGRFDVLLWRGARPRVAAPAAKPLEQLANDPLLSLRVAKVCATLRDTLAASLPEYAVPHFIVPLPRFLRNANGKVDATALPLPARLRQAGSGAAQGSALENQVAAVWETVLELRGIGLEEDFFAIGGDSLKAVRVAAELGAVLERELSPALLFEHRTVSALAGSLEGGAAAPAPAQAAGRGSLRRARISNGARHA